MTDATAGPWTNWQIRDFDPRAPIKRWTHVRKLALLLAIDHSSISEAEACAVHGISQDELAEWRRRVADYGVEAIKLTKQPWCNPEGRA